MTEILGGIDDLWTIRSDVNKVSEEAVAKAQQDARQAKHIAQQIKKDKAINLYFSRFLSFLMNAIEEEQIITEIYNTFYKTVNPDTQVTYLRKDANVKVMIGFFVPFFIEDVKKFGIWTAYEGLAPETVKDLHSYIHYLGILSEKYHDHIPIYQEGFINLILLIAIHYLPSKESLSKEQLLTLLWGEQ